MNRMFLFGSLSKGMSQFSKVEGLVEAEALAKVTGSVYRLPSGFPVLLEQGSCSVEGTFVKLKSTLAADVAGVPPGNTPRLRTKSTYKAGSPA